MGSLCSFFSGMGKLIYMNCSGFSACSLSFICFGSVAVCFLILCINAESSQFFAPEVLAVVLSNFVFSVRYWPLLLSRLSWERLDILQINYLICRQQIQVQPLHFYCQLAKVQVANYTLYFKANIGSPQHNQIMFRKYLSQLAKKSLGEVDRFVLGNSSVDYDSFFGSILMAFLLTTFTRKFHLPIIDCTKDELHSRFDIVHILKKLDINSGIFKYQESLGQLKKHSLFSLYDHNVRAGITNIDYIVDHHDYKEPIARKYLIDRMGSALTHLYYLMYPSKLDLANCNSETGSSYEAKYLRFIEGEQFQAKIFENEPEEEVEQIIRYGVLLDTYNFDPKLHERWTVFDKRALQNIEKKKKFEINFADLEELKFNRELNLNLSLDEALRKDRKIIDYNGVEVDYSIIYLPPKDFHAHYAQAFKEHPTIANQKSDAVILMSVFKDEQGSIQRQLMFKIKEGREEVANMLGTLLSSLKMTDQGKIQDWSWWKDPSATMSRKILDKQFRKFIDALPKKE